MAKKGTILINAKKGTILINTEDIVGKRLGKLEVVGYSGCYYVDTKGGPRLRHYYLCECDCGVMKYIQRSQLKNEIIHSCGCERGRRRND